MIKHRTRVVMICGIVVTLAVSGAFFVIAHSPDDGDAAQAGPPTDPGVGPDTTPVPGATPDMHEPGWYVPYLNADRAKKQFVGGLAGIEVRPFDASVRPEDSGGCPPGTGQLRERFDEAVNKESLGIRLGAVAAGTPPQGPPKALECDGRLVAVEQYFDVLSADASGTIAGSLKVFRSAVGHRFWLPAAEDRWAAAIVSGRPAATLRPVIETIGTSAVILNDGQGYTAVVGEGVTLEFLKRAAEEIER